MASTIKGSVRAIGNRVLVSNMHFGEQTTASGLIIKNDDGTTRGIYPRWAKVYAKGPDNLDEYEIGDWILIEHGRWTRHFNVERDDELLEVRMVESESVMMYSKERPDGVQIGKEYSNGPATIDPGSFIRPDL
jgi:co-chaperonin GroES (HSP10)